MISTVAIITTALLYVGYLGLALACRIGFIRVHGMTPPGITEPLPPVTVIVPARNEALRIDDCIRSIEESFYPDDLTNIVVVDDGSTDSTSDIVEARQTSVSSLKLVRTGSPTGDKVNAIAVALRGSENEIILTTDADCIVAPNWIHSMIARLDDRTAFVAGPVLYTFDKTVWQRLQALEFLGLVAVGAGSIGAGMPTICNSANLCYRRSVYLAIANQLETPAGLPGVDEVMIQRIGRDSDWTVAFCPGSSAAVYTRPCDNIRDFFRQRVRWASMAGRMPDGRVVSISACIFLFYAGLSGLFVAALAGAIQFVFPAALFGGKLAADLVLLLPATANYERTTLRRLIPFAELVHIPYILLTSLFGLLPGRRW